MRRRCDRIDIIDLGGEGRGTRKDENVFAIQTPVAIFIAWRKEKADPDKPAATRYARIEGTRDEKLKKLAAISSADDLAWKKIPSDWQAPFRPDIKGIFFDWPEILNIFPWQANGIKVGRSWVIGPDAPILRARLEEFVNYPTAEKAVAFKESPTGRKLTDSPNQLPPELAFENEDD
jgi:hypothetical protein